MPANKYSNLKIFGFPEKLQSYRDGRITAPIYVRIKPINRCNHACHWCVYSDGTKRSKDRPDKHLQAHMHADMDEGSVMPREKGLELLNDLADIGTKAVTFSGGGEPLLHRNIAEFLGLSLERGLDLSIITNGQLLSGERASLLAQAKWVRVSMDYTCVEQMVASRNTAERAFTDVLKNMEEFASMKDSGCDLGINFIVTRDNHEGLVDFSRRMKDLGVGNIRFSPVYTDGFQAYHGPIKERVEEQLRLAQTICDDEFTINTTYDLDSSSKKPVRKYSRCYVMQNNPVVGADLGVYACHNVAYAAHGLIGSIATRKFSDLWFSDEAKAVFDGLNPCKVCLHECANDAKNLLYHELVNANFDNFI